MRVAAVVPVRRRRRGAGALLPFVWVIGQDVVHPAQQRLEALFH
jgi:hypothetical protein